MNRTGIPSSDWKEFTPFDGAEVLVPGKVNIEPDEKMIFSSILRVIIRYLRVSVCQKADSITIPSSVQKPIDDISLNPEDDLEKFGLISEILLRNI